MQVGGALDAGVRRPAIRSGRSAIAVEDALNAGATQAVRRPRRAIGRFGRRRALGAGAAVASRRRSHAIGGLGRGGALVAPTVGAVRQPDAAVGRIDALDALRRGGVAAGEQALGAVAVAAARDDAVVLDADAVAGTLQVDVALVALAVGAAERPIRILAIGVDDALLASAQHGVADLIAFALGLLLALDATPASAPDVGARPATIAVGVVGAGRHARRLERIIAVHDAADLSCQAVRCIAAAEATTGYAMNRRRLAVLIAVALGATEHLVTGIGTTGAERIVRIAGLRSPAASAAHTGCGRRRRRRSARPDTAAPRAGLRRRNEIRNVVRAARRLRGEPCPGHDEHR